MREATCASTTTWRTFGMSPITSAPPAAALPREALGAPSDLARMVQRGSNTRVCQVASAGGWAAVHRHCFLKKGDHHAIASGLRGPPPNTAKHYPEEKWIVARLCRVVMPDVLWRRFGMVLPKSMGANRSSRATHPLKPDRRPARQPTTSTRIETRPPSDN